MKRAAQSHLRLSDIDYSPDVQIRIRPAGTTFLADCFVGQDVTTVPIDLTLDDAAALAKGIQCAIDDAKDSFVDTGDVAALKEELHDLAEAGYAAFQNIFRPQLSAQFLSLLRKREQEREKLLIQITAKEFSVPWDLIYPKPLSAKLSYKEFWGMRHIVFRNVEPNIRDGAAPGHVIPTSRPIVGLLTDLGLPAVEDYELPFFQQEQRDERIRLYHLKRELDAGRWHEEFAAVRRFLNRSYHILHLACHADCDGDGQCTFTITRNFEVGLKRLEAYNCWVQGNPVVFLNACRTSNLAPKHLLNFARYFLESGARGVIATECKVPDGAFAADFAKHIYKAFLNGEPLGQSLLSARQYYLERANPLGLMYSLYGPPSVRFERSNHREKIG
jgi:hypothetical protein